MRIEKIVLSNYRQFRQVELTFPKGHSGDLHFVVGTNGTGKTNLLNAINWCLYGDEPHLSKGSEGLPLLNLGTLSRMVEGEEQRVAVEVWAATEDGAPVVFTREALFGKNDDGGVSGHGTQFRVRYSDERGNTKIVGDDEALAWVERFVPARIREFFFFDGERLDSYFKEATGQHIRHAVFEISQVQLLEDCVERKLRETLADLEREAGKMSPKMEEARAKLEKAESELGDLERRVEECEKQIAIAKAKIAEYAEELKGVPDIAALEEERERLEAEARETRQLLKAKEHEKRDLLLECGTILMVWPAIERATEVVDAKRRDQEIPPPVDKAFLEEVLRAGTCAVCGRGLDAGSSKQVEGLLRRVELSSTTGRQLLEMESGLYQLKDRAAEFEERVRAMTREIEGHGKRLAQIADKKDEIDRQVAGYDKERVREWYRERARFEGIRDENQIALGELRVMRDVYERIVADAKKERDNELKRRKALTGVRRRVAFCERALGVVRATRQTMMAETREKIQEETERQFLALVWKKATFADVRIEADYSIALVHSMGYECLGTVSAGERELLALSFTLALHRASGFDSPVLIDTPVARISDVNRENFATVLDEVSTDKQIVLLFTPAEYSPEISKSLDGRAGGRYRLDLAADEVEAVVEVL